MQINRKLTVNLIIFFLQLERSKVEEQAKQSHFVSNRSELGAQERGLILMLRVIQHASQNINPAAVGHCFARCY